LRFRHELTRNLRLKQIGAVLYLDIDHFKEINQSYSEEVGDELLIQVGERIHRSIEKHNFCSRYKNDEFIIILNEFETNKEDVTQQIWNEAQKILAVIQTPFQLKNHDIRIGASIGIRLFPATYLAESEYFRNAKQAMQQSKEKGKNTISFFNDEVQQRIIKRHSLHRDFQKALSAKEFSLHFQPLVNSKKVIVGAEVLSRWNHKSLGVIPPIEFLPFLKDMQNIKSHTRWIIQEVCRFYKNSTVYQLPKNFQRISINLNENQFYWSELQQCFVEECNRYNISTTGIELEITEATIEKFPKRSLEICQSLKNSGFHLCIDDFGSNHSNIAFLQKFPISRLKIDIKLISNLHRKNTGIDAIVKSLIAIATHLGVEILAEGVELESHYSELKNSPCKLYQGFYFSRPLPEKVFSEILTMEVL
jgi:diguanylate cyclase (GGDEF)-like protein